MTRVRIHSRWFLLSTLRSTQNPIFTVKLGVEAGSLRRKRSGDRSGQPARLTLNSKQYFPSATQLGWKPRGNCLTLQTQHGAAEQRVRAEAFSFAPCHRCDLPPMTTPIPKEHLSDVLTNSILPAVSMIVSRVGADTHLITSAS